MIEIGLSRLRMCRISLRDWGCLPLLERPGRKKLPSALFRSNWVKHDPNPRSDRSITICFFRSPIAIMFTSFGSEKRQKKRSADGDALQRGPLEIDLEERIRHIPRRQRSISNISGAKVHASMPKGTFSTDWESDGIRNLP